LVLDYRDGCHSGSSHIVGLTDYRSSLTKLTSSFMPETLRSLVGDGSIPPPPLNMSPPMLWRHRQTKHKLAKAGEEGEHIDRPPRKKVS
jgi:hypothetical protein